MGSTATQEMTDSELMQALAHVVNHSLSFITSMSLKCAIQLGIPDIIHNHGQPMSLSSLIDALSLPPSKTDAVNRLMGFLVHSGFFATQKIDENKEVEAFLLTPSSRILLKDNRNCLSTLALVMVEPEMIAPWQLLGDWFRGSGSTPFEAANGMSIWNFLGYHPELRKNFGQALANKSSLEMSEVVNAGKAVFENLRSLVDVGGGHGTTAQALVEAFPHLKCVVLDLPNVVADLPKRNNIEYVAGDMFESIPQANTALIKCVLHDWSDSDCVRILKRCREVIPSREDGGKVIIIEIVMKDRKQEHDEIITETQFFLDMLMMTIGGKERSEKEWKDLFVESGYSDYKITPVPGLCSIIEVYP